MQTKPLFANTAQATLLSICAAVLSACAGNLGPQSQGQLSAVEEYRLSTLDVNMYPSNKLVCDPWGGGGDPRSNAGLKAELFYLLPSQQKFTSVKDVISNGRKSSQDLFFNSLNVPTRRFETGFINDLGEAVKDDDQNVLVEHFALRFKTVLKLAPDQEPGLYQLAILSDDGAVVRIRDADGQYREYINNDGDHATRMGCADRTIQMDRDTERLMEIDYYQGPRYHISLIMMMRKVDSESAAKDSSCGHASNEDWFNYHVTPTMPRDRYTSLLARGWNPLSPANYSLPNSATFNPCKEGEAPEILTFRISEVGSTSATVIWTTDIPATSQLAALDVGTGQSIITASDNALRTSHRVTITGLKPDTEYALTAISISDTYGKAMSPPMGIMTEP